MSKKYSFSSFADWKGISIIALSAAGVILSLYLTVNYFGGNEMSYCMTGTDCDVVKKSAFSKILGMPVSLVGVIGYAAILTAIFTVKTKRKKWNTLFILTTAGFSFSVYLTYIEIFVIKAICSYCIASAVLITLILTLVILKKETMYPKLAIGKGLLIFLFLSATVFAGSYSLQKPASNSPEYLGKSSEKQESLAIHLSETGAVMYGAYNCPHCIDQKKMFGEAFRHIEYVECSSKGPDPKPSLCFVKGIRNYPTWEINGRFYQGQLSYERLADITKFNQ